MKLYRLRISNFQSFGPDVSEIILSDLISLIGPNGAGKTAVMQALCRLFAFDPLLKRSQKTDFHVPHDEVEVPSERNLQIKVL